MYSSIQTGQGLGMQTLDQCLSTLVKNGSISSAEARGKASNKDMFPG
jgi:twitching motility protein PilT